MTKSLQDMNVAILMANGFDEPEFIEMQKKMQEMGAKVRIVSTNQGLVNGWSGQGWGHNHAVDVSLNGALGVDYDVLVIASGARSFEKLSATAHTRRFISSMMGAGKPVIAMGDAVALMARIEQLEGMTVAAPQDSHEACHEAGARLSEGATHVDGNLMSGSMDLEDKAGYFAHMEEFLNSTLSNMAQQARAA
ncbi:MAG: DJ-1/PfpI family protein [Alphaproteobacteria bacterium]|nr:DJ-1/PfpI family protein [Alphaproteobacteria bacterium]